MNLFAGQASFETVMQVIFAISWGFILTMAFYKSGSLIPYANDRGVLKGIVRRQRTIK